MTVDNEEILRAHYENGMNTERASLDHEISEFHAANWWLKMNPMIVEAMRIRKVREDAMISCPVEPGSMSMHDCKFLKDIALAAKTMRSRYLDVHTFSCLVQIDVKAIRSDHGANPQPPSDLINCQALANSAAWSDEELITWLGRYEYITRDADSDLRDVVLRLYKIMEQTFAPESSPEQVAQPSVGEVVQPLAPESTVPDPVEPQYVDAKLYSTREAAMIFYSLLEALSENSTFSMNIAAACRLLNRLTGGSIDNFNTYIDQIKAHRLMTNPRSVSRVKADLLELGFSNVQFDVLDEIADRSIERELENKDKRQS